MSALVRKLGPSSSAATPMSGVQSRWSEEIKKSALKVVDAKRDTSTRAKHLRLFIDNVTNAEAVAFFESYYSHVFYVVYDAFVAAEHSLRTKGAHKTQKEELEAALYLLEKILLYLPEHLSRKWQFHSVGRLMAKLLHPANSWRILKREAIRLFLIWYQILGDAGGERLDALFATLVPGFSSPYEGLGITALAAITPQDSSQLISSVDNGPLIPSSASDHRWPSRGVNNNETSVPDLTRVFLEVLLDLMVSQGTLIEWRAEVKNDRQLQCLNFLIERFKRFYLPQIFPNFDSKFSLYTPSLELPEKRRFKPVFVDNGDGTKKLDPIMTCRIVVIKWIAQYVHQTKALNGTSNATSASSTTYNGDPFSSLGSLTSLALEPTTDGVQGSLMRRHLYSSRENVNFVHEIFRQAFLLPFNHSAAIKRVIAVYKDWIQMNVAELPPFLMEPVLFDKSSSPEVTQGLKGDSYLNYFSQENLAIRAGLQNLMQIFITNAANVFLLEISPDYPILLDEQVEMCKRVLNLYRYMVMNVRMESRTWEQLLFILLQITQLTLPESPPRRRDHFLGGRLSQAIFQTLIVTWIKANLYVVVSTELWDQFLDVLSSLTLWDELIKEWAKTMETLTRVLARQVYHLDLNDLPLERLSERAAKKRRGRQQSQSDVKNSTHLDAVRKPSSGSMSGERDTTGSTSATAVSSSQHRASHSSDTASQGSGYTRCFKPKDRLFSEATEDTNMDYIETHLEEEVAIKRSQSLPLLADEASQLDGTSGYHLENNGLGRRRHSAESVHLDTIVDEACSVVMVPSTSPIQHHLMMNEHIGAGTATETLSCHASTGAMSSLLASSLNQEGPKSVMSGGSVKGWLPDVAVVLWRRMLGALGDINLIRDTVIHALIYKYLIELFETLVKIRNNQGVQDSNNTSLNDNINITIDESADNFVPPLTIFAPWCFRAQLLPEAYQRGKLYALRLLCLLTCRQQDTPLPQTHLIQFYKVLHEGLTSPNQPEVLQTLIKFTGPRFFSLALPGYTAFVMDFLHACNTVLCSNELKNVPRTEAASIVAVLLPYTTLITSGSTNEETPLLLPDGRRLSMMAAERADLKEQVVGVLLKSGKREPAGLARCIALCCLATFVYNELLVLRTHSKIKEAIQVLLTALKFNNKAVAGIASDMLLLLADQSKNLLKLYPEIASRVIEAMAKTLLSSFKASLSSHEMSQDHRSLLLRLTLCLGEWCMRMPRQVLLANRGSNTRARSSRDTDDNENDEGIGDKDETETSVLAYVLGVLQEISTKERETSNPDQTPTTATSDFDHDIHVDNTHESLNARTPLSPERATAVENEQVENEDHHDGDDEGNESIRVVKLAARNVLGHLINFLFHFPISESGLSSLSSLISEQDDYHPNKVVEKTRSSDDPKLLASNNIQFFVLKQSVIISLVQMHNDEEDEQKANKGSKLRLFFRDLTGKFVWDVRPVINRNTKKVSSVTNQPKSPALTALKKSIHQTKRMDAEKNQGTKRYEKAGLPLATDNNQDHEDKLDKLLNYLSVTSPECLQHPEQPLNSVTVTAKEQLQRVVEQQTTSESDFCRQSNNLESLGLKNEKPLSEGFKDVSQNENPIQGFDQCRRLMNQLGWTTWDRRPDVHLLNKNERFIRELKNLDSRRNRETHKIAVIYVAFGQEDKNSILANTRGSDAFENFVASLGWNVDLESHQGFMGGLQRSKGSTAPYYATGLTEVLFHVSTHMDSGSSESLLQKTRHIGNDEVHVVWSEHDRDYRRGILPTEFCDVLIVIYPLQNGLFRIQISRKADVPFFGPLFNEMVVDGLVLSGLVRATALNASRAKRSMMKLYQTHFEEREQAVTQMVTRHVQKTSFEHFVARLFNSSNPVHRVSIASDRPLHNEVEQDAMAPRLSLQGFSDAIANAVARSRPVAIREEHFSDSHNDNNNNSRASSPASSTSSTPSLSVITRRR